MLVRTMFLLDIVDRLDARGVPHALAGGWAVALHGVPRGTVDVDLVVRWTLKNLRLVEKALGELGLVPRQPIGPDGLFRFRRGRAENGNPAEWGFLDPVDPTRQVDVIVTMDLKDAEVERIPYKGRELRTLSKKDLIDMKRASGRRQDAIDADALERLP